MPELGSLAGKRVLLVIAGGIAAYKCLELVRRLKERGVAVRAVLTKGGAQFVTPLSVQALTEDKVYQDLFSLTDESEMGHIRLSRETDLIVVAPATADLLARMAAGLADDLATTVLLASDKPVLVAPAMNLMMWDHPATQANLRTLEGRGVRRVGPGAGALACGEVGSGRMAEPADILAAIADFFANQEVAATTGPLTLKGRRALVTSGPTHEPIDPVRFIANRSSGRQGHALAAALAARGAEVVLVSGPVTLADPPGVTVVKVETARQMLDAVRAAGPVDIAVCAAAVADWRVEGEAADKLKKALSGPPTLRLVENPDILASLSAPGPGRPALVVGFAAETTAVLEHARAKLARKGCDWIIANDVATGTGTFGGEDNAVHLLRRGPDEAAPAGVETWPRLPKTEVAARLADAIARHFTPA